MTETRRKSPEVASNTVTVLLAKQKEHLVDSHPVKVVVVGSAPKGVAVTIAILFKVSGFFKFLTFHVTLIFKLCFYVHICYIFTTVIELFYYHVKI